jgi:hypothetical protein
MAIFWVYLFLLRFPFGEASDGAARSEGSYSMINHKMLKSHKSWARSLGGEVFLGGSFASENILP